VAACHSQKIEDPSIQVMHWTTHRTEEVRSHGMQATIGGEQICEVMQLVGVRKPMKLSKDCDNVSEPDAGMHS